MAAARQPPRRLRRARLHDGGEVGRQPEAPHRQPRARRPRRRPRERGQARARRGLARARQRHRRPRPRRERRRAAQGAADHLARRAGRRPARRRRCRPRTTRSSGACRTSCAPACAAPSTSPHGTRSWPASPPAAAAPTRRRRVQAFSLAVTPLPGVRVPKGPKGSIPEGTLAISWVLANYGRLTPGVRQAFDKAVRRAFGLSGHPAAGGAKLDAIKAQAITFVGQQAGVDLTLPITIVRGYPRSGRGAAVLGVDAAGSYRSSQPAARCIISVRGGASRDASSPTRSSTACRSSSPAAPTPCSRSTAPARGWGRAARPTPAACSRRTARRRTASAYAGYVEQPTTPLGRRTYDAVGFFAHLDQVGAGALGTVEEAIARAVDGGRLPGARQRGRRGHLRLVGLEPLPRPVAAAPRGTSAARAPRRARSAADPTPIVLGQGPR